MAESEDISLEEIRKLSNNAMEENIAILQALADYDKKEPKNVARTKPLSARK